MVHMTMQIEPSIVQIGMNRAKKHVNLWGPSRSLKHPGCPKLPQETFNQAKTQFEQFVLLAFNGKIDPKLAKPVNKANHYGGEYIPAEMVLLSTNERICTIWLTLVCVIRVSGSAKRISHRGQQAFKFVCSVWADFHERRLEDGCSMSAEPRIINCNFIDWFGIDYLSKLKI